VPPSTYRDGNRLPLPAGWADQHFLYKPQAPEVDASACAVLTEAVKEVVFDAGLYPAQVEIVSRNRLAPAALAALEQLSAPLVAVPCLRDRQVSIIVCEQALPHTDPGYAGSSFLSLVIHTGPGPYQLQLLHSHAGAAGAQLTRSSRLLQVGDWVVFDPLTPHYAVPLQGSQDNLLVLLQVELNDHTVGERARILEVLPRAPGDGNAPDFCRYPKRGAAHVARSRSRMIPKTDAAALPRLAAMAAQDPSPSTRSRQDSPHFIYQTQASGMDTATAAVLVENVKTLVLEMGLHPAQIEIVNRGKLAPGAAAAFEQLAAPLLQVPCVRDHEVSMVVCEQALPHTDPEHEGSAFLSLVLHTGPEPYYLQLLHSTVGATGQDVISSSRVLRAGDWVVFDQTTPHMAVPLFGSKDSLLVLLQTELKADTAEDRAAVQRAVPPLADDRDVPDLSFL
jgi:hypothetical protein